MSGMGERNTSPADIGWLHGCTCICQSSVNYVLKMGEFDCKRVKPQ